MSLDSLRLKLGQKQSWIRKKYDYYEQKNLRPDPSPIIANREALAYNSKLGWCTRAVDALANRLNFDEFENDNFDLMGIFRLNSPDVFFDSAIKSALISACCFVYISTDIDGEVRLQVIDGINATGVKDPITGLLTEGYAVLDCDDNGNVTSEAYFTADATYYFVNKILVKIVKNNTGYPLLVPVIYKPSDKQPFGYSRITAAGMDLMDKARYTITRTEVTGEFGVIPQKYVLGLDPNAEFDSMKNSYKSILAIDKDSDGDKPVVGQFAQASSSSHISTLEKYQEEFNKEMGMDSAEELESIALKAQGYFGTGFLNIGLVSACLRDDTRYKRNEIYKTIPIWKPVFRVDNASINALGDGLIKMGQVIPGAVDARAIKRMTGLPIEVE